MRITQSGKRFYKQVQAPTVLVNRVLYEQYGLYDEDLKWRIDREMWHRWLSHGVVKKFIDKPVAIYRRHPRQISKNPSIKQPKVIDKKFRKIVAVRRKLDRTNTLFMEDYDHNSLIGESI